jgi:hypothetical protein
LSTGILRHVVSLKSIDVSALLTASIIRATVPYAPALERPRHDIPLPTFSVKKASTSETSVSFCETPRRDIAEGCDLTRRREISLFIRPTVGLFQLLPNVMCTNIVSRLGGVAVIVLATEPKGRVLKLGRCDGFLRTMKIRSTPSFGWEVKPEVPCRKILRRVKDPLRYFRY